MRDYPTVPNVFRVASSHSVNTDCATSGGNSGCDIKITSGTNANLPTGQLRQQKQQQQPNGNISGQQQSLVKSSISSQTTTTTKTTTATTKQTASITAAATTTSATTSTLSTILKTNTTHRNQQQQQQKNKNDFDFIMQNHNSLQVQPQSQYPHKLTTHASIERPQCLQRTTQSYLQQSPYATLPRNPTTSLSTLSLMSANANTITDADIRKQQEQQQQHHNSTSNSNNKSNNSNSNNSNNKTHKSSTNDPTMLGVINTISGSIPATGYTNSNGGSNIGHRTISMSSDLNIGSGMNNSCTNLSKLNGIQQQQQQQQQQQKQLRLQHQQQQQSTLQHRDFKQTSTTIDDFTTYRRQYPCSSLERSTNGYLWIITPVAASISVAIVIAALAGPQWLFTEEKLPNTLYNGTANFNVLDDGAFITRYTKSSLWIICTTLQGVETYSCIKIDYFSEKGYQPDPHDSSSAIPYTVTKSCPFFLASGIVLLLSFIVFLIPTCSHQNNLYYFSAGIMFIVSGLLMLIGLIAYISILKAEIGSKLRPRSTLQPPLFKVTYGQSFFLFVFGFIATEFVGLLNIFLYISLQEVGYYSRLPCFTISNLQEKIKEGENRFNSHTYKSYKHEIENKKPLERKRNQQNKKLHQTTAQELELDTKKLLKNMTQVNGTGHKSGDNGSVRTGRKVVDAAIDASTGPYACRKHPNGLGSTMFLNELDRRYYFEKPSSSATQQSKCNLHSRNLAKSLNELYNESSSSSAFLPPPPPPSAIRAGGGGGLLMQTQTLPRPPQQFSDSPQGFPLTRSVSTTTDIYATQNSNFSGMTATKADNRKRNVATNTRHNNDTETQTNGNGGVGGGGVGANSQQKVQLQQRGNNNNNTQSKKPLPQQLQQQNQRHKNNKTYATNDDNNHQRYRHHNNNHHQQQHPQRTTVNGNNINKDNDDNFNHDDVDDIEDVDEEQPQKLCGLKRTIRKTKDELFEEFCKRAGVRPKPKNIYYIENHEGEEDDDIYNDNDGNDNILTVADNNATTQQSAAAVAATIEDEEMLRKPLRLNNVRSSNLLQRRSEAQGNHQLHQQMQQQLQKQHSLEYRRSVGGMENSRMYGEAVDVVDIDDDVDENGFRKLTENEDHLYVIDDNIHLMPQAAIRNGRRASMYVEPNHLRRLNSNLSLHAIYAPTATATNTRAAGLQKSLYDLDTSGNEFSYITTHNQQQQKQPHYTLRDTYGGSQQRLHHDYHNQAIYQSRTLPRTFLKRNADSQDSIVSAVGLNASATQLHNMYSASQQRLTNLMMQQQQQQQNRYLSMSREQELYNSRYSLHKSNEELNRQYVHQQQQQQPIYIQPHQLQQYQQQQQHATVSAQNYNSNLKQPSLVQWPAAIPSSPSNFSGSFRMYSPLTPNNNNNTNNTTIQNLNNNHALLTRSNSNGTAASIITAGGQQVVVNGSITTSGSQGPPKFQRAYAFDEQRRPSAILADAFDLDEIERERRRSHASLFNSNLGVNVNTTVNSNGMMAGGSHGGGNTNSNSKNQDHYDMINGTAV